MRSLPIQKYGACLEQASMLVKRLHPESISPSHVGLTFLLCFGLDAMLQKMEALRGKGQTCSRASLEVKKSLVTHQNLE